MLHRSNDFYECGHLSVADNGQLFKTFQKETSLVYSGSGSSTGIPCILGCVVIGCIIILS